jgi:hypothetical protein
VARSELYVGVRIRPCTSTTRNPAPAQGEMCFETNTGRVRVWTGDSWVGLFDDSGVIGVNSPLSAWTNGTESVLQKRNGNVHLRLGSFQRTGGTVPDGGARLPVLIPAAYRHPTRDQYGICYVTGVQIARITVYSANSDKPGQVWVTQYPTISKGDYVLPGSGISWVVD